MKAPSTRPILMDQTLLLLSPMSPDQVSIIPNRVFTSSMCLCQYTGGVAVDWINDKVYFSFGEVTPDHLVIYDIHTGSYDEINMTIAVITTSCFIFYDLAVDPIDGYRTVH